MVQTPFEQTGVATSIAAAEDWCEALAAAHPHVTLQMWGQPAGPARRLGMFTLTIGTGRVGMTVLGSIHGEEPAGRETAMAFARDLAESTDPVVEAYLAEHSVSIMVTCNPSGSEDNRRTNDNGIDIGRSFDTLEQPENIAITRWMLWAVPVLTIDLHEMTAATTAAQVATGTMPAGGNPALLPLGLELDDLFQQAVLDAGYTVIDYPTLADGTFRKHGAPTYKVVAQLIETNRNHIPTFAGRVAVQRLVLNVALEHHRLNAAEYEAAHLAAGGSGGGTFPTETAGRFVIRDGAPAPAVVAVIRDGEPVPV